MCYSVTSGRRRHDPPRRPGGRICLAGLGLVFLATVPGCGHQEYGEASTVESVLPLPKTLGEAPGTGIRVEEWAEAVNAPQLGLLMEQAYTRNFRWQAAFARVERAQALAAQAGGRRWPGVEGTASAGRSKQRVPSGLTEAIPSSGGRPGSEDGAGENDVLTFTQNSYEIGVAASYEVDLWNRLGKREEAARLQAEAAGADTKTVAVSLNAGIAQAYFEILETKERQEVLRAQRRTAGEQLALIKRRYGQGQTSVLDLTRQEQKVESFESQLTAASEGLDSARQRLAVLLGAPPQDFQPGLPAVMPEPPPLPEPGFPADLLTARPDLHAALLRLRAADAETAAHAAAQLPEIRLSARLFGSANAIENLFDTLLWALSGESSQTLFDAGASAARTRAAEAEAKAALAELGQAWLEALQDVAAALTRAESVREQGESLRRQLQLAEAGLDLVQRRYANGQASYLRVLEATEARDDTELRLIEVRLAGLLARVQLLRALGGTWVESVPPQPVLPPDNGNRVADE